MATTSTTETKNVGSSNVGTRDKSVGWYVKDEPEVSRAAREVLEVYSHISSERVVPYVVEMRDRAWDVFPFPCVGRYGFVDFFIHTTPSYEAILQRLRNGASFLDLGCCFGQDLRKLAHDGVDVRNLWGAELDPHFIELGYEFFGDKDKLDGRIMAADVFDLGGPLKQLHGRIDIVQLGLFLHQFNWNGQFQTVKHVVQIAKPEKGSLVVGRSVASAVAGEYPSRGGKSTMYRHDVASFERLWNEIGLATGSKWEVRAQLDKGLGVDSGKRSWDRSDTRQLMFEVERLA